MIRHVSQVSALTLASRVLGFLRDVLIARHLGAGLASDAFFIAFKLPNFFRRLFAEGAFSAAFVPLYTAARNRDPAGHEARRLAEEALAALVTILLGLTILVQIALPVLIYLLAPGFAEDAAKRELAVALTRLTFPYLLCISVVALFSGVLNAHERFAAPAAAPVLLNLTFITALLIGADSPLITARRLAVAVSVAGIVQLVWLVLAAGRAGIRLRFRRPRWSRRLAHLVSLMLPVALGAGITQVNLLIDVMLASFLPDGSLSFLFYADRLNQLPLGVIGVAVGTTLLPGLSRSFARADVKGAERLLAEALTIILALALPAALALIIVPDILIAGLFERGAFDAADTRATAAALMAYASGLPAYMLTKALVPVFYAEKDTRTPTRLALIALGANFALNLALIGPLAHVGLALATSLAAWLQTGLLAHRLFRRRRLSPALIRRLPIRPVAAASMVMAAALAGLRILFRSWPVGTVMAVAITVGTGLAVYALTAWLLGLHRRILRPQRPTPPA
ncbi:MAG: murein biosynthesis integral membrane protein MurJ [Alphaproteobacteria bacterium]|nr:MAG: murein biosynthesis integral membrane protein MurJ [Alphaproteobacteria bacterium]